MSDCLLGCMLLYRLSLMRGCDRKHAGVVSAQRHGPRGSGVQGHRQRLPQSHHRFYVSVLLYMISMHKRGGDSPHLEPEGHNQVEEAHSEY